MITTPAMLADEARLVGMARGGRGRFRPLGDKERPLTRDWLNAGQRRRFAAFSALMTW